MSLLGTRRVLLTSVQAAPAPRPLCLSLFHLLLPPASQSQRCPGPVAPAHSWGGRGRGRCCPTWAVAAAAMAARPPSAVTSGCWASAGPPPALGHLLGLLGSQGWHLAGHRRWEHQGGCEAPVAPSLGTQLLAVPTRHVLTKSCLGMTAMLTLRRAEPCNRGAGGEHCEAASLLLLPLTSPAPARGTTGHCQLPLGGEAGKPGKVKAKRSVPVITAASCSGGAA